MHLNGAVFPARNRWDTRPGRAFIVRTLLSSRVYSAALLGVALTTFSACQKTHEITASERAGEPGIVAYAEKVGTSPAALLEFSDSLWSVKGSHTQYNDCLKHFPKSGKDSQEVRDSFLHCMAQKGQLGFSKKFLEELIPVRLVRMREVHHPEMLKSLGLLNWIFDLALEQYHVGQQDGGYWLEKAKDSDEWTFMSDIPASQKNSQAIKRRNHVDFPYQEGDLNLQISSSNLSTLIPQYTRPQRRLTHMMIFHDKRGFLKEHFVEAVFEEGVRPKYLDLYRVKDSPFENYVLRFKDSSRSEQEIAQIKVAASDFAESQIGARYSFTVNKSQRSNAANVKDNGYFCTYLSGLSYVDAISNALTGSRMGLVFDDVRKLFHDGFSPLRKGRSRKFAEEFGVKPEEEDFPSAGDFLTATQFEATALFVRPDQAREFSDRYALGEAFVDELDKGASVIPPEKERKKFNTYMIQRPLIIKAIDMVRRVHRHSVFRDAILKAGVSLEMVGSMNVPQFKTTMDKLKKEQKALMGAVQDALTRDNDYWPDGGPNVFDGKDVDFFKGLQAKWALKNAKTKAEKSIKKVRSEAEISSSINEVLLDLTSIENLLTRLDLNQLITIITQYKDTQSKLPANEQLHNVVLEDVVEKLKADQNEKSNWNEFWSVKKQRFTEDEVKDLTEAIKTYVVFLLIVPSLSDEANSHPDEALQTVLKGMPFFASDLKAETLLQFMVFNKMADKILEKFGEVRSKLGLNYLWQTPPWVQRSYMEMILKKAPVVKYE